ncbi:MAG: site-2 protease family protein [Thaumarchaeota archaeon]|nr:site-2 protease family protein [Nitrososphaerota archaeon]
MEKEYKRFEFQFGFILLRTKRFHSLMDRLGSLRISKPVGWFLLYLMPVAAGTGLFIFLTNLAAFFSPRVHDIGTVVREVSPLAYLGLPGVNPYLPLVDGWFALIVAMVIHEGAHGVVARSLGFPVKSSGLIFFLVLPIGAFVEVDEEALKAAKARDSGRVLASGASVNLVLGIVALLALFSIVGTMTPAVRGLAVTQVGVNTPAAAARMLPGDFIVSVNGISYDNTSVFASAPWYRPGQNVTVMVWRQGQEVSLSVTLGTNPSNSSLGYFGIAPPLGYSDLKAVVTTYTNSFFSRPITYVCIPTFPRCQGLAPFSDQLSVFYTSPYGASLVPLAGVIFWLFFLNFNLAVFNALPIYPLDGGQAFRAGLKGLAGGRLGEKGLSRISTAVTIAVVVIIASFPLAAYLNLV